MNASSRRKSHQFHISGHAKVRMRERRVPPWVVRSILDSGVYEELPDRQCIRVLFPHEALDQPALRGYADVELIIDPYYARVITVQRLSDRGETRKERPDRRCHADRAESNYLRVFTGETGPGSPPPDRSPALAAESQQAVASGELLGEGPSRMETPAGAGGSHDAGPPASPLAGADTPAYHARPDRWSLAELDRTLEPIEGFLRGLWLLRVIVAVGIVLGGLAVCWALTTVW